MKYLSFKKKPGILLWGGTNKARIIEAMLKEDNLGFAKVIFDSAIEKLEFTTSASFVNNIDELSDFLELVSNYIVCIGGEHGYARFKRGECLEKLGLKPFSIKHCTSFIDPTATIGLGYQIMPYAVIHKFVSIGKQVIINTNATIDHECSIGNGVHIMGNVAIAGEVTIEDFATIGTNATILPSIKIGKGSFIGAGAVVTRDVEPLTIVSGVPAKFLRRNNLKFYEQDLRKLMSQNSKLIKP